MKRTKKNISKAVCLVALTSPLTSQAGTTEEIVVADCTTALVAYSENADTTISSKLALECIQTFERLSTENLDLEIHNEEIIGESRLAGIPWIQ